MRLPTRLLVVASLASSVCAEGDCDAVLPCMEPYAPVCDSRDTTHFSECHFRAAQCKQPTLEIIAHGVCCPIACPLVVAKVCGSDGETYNSPCELLRARCDGAKSTLRITSPGACGVDCSTINCAGKPYVPLCGSDWRTYDNDCELKRAQCLGGDPEEPSPSYDGPCIDGPPQGDERLTADGEDAMPLFTPLELGDEDGDPYEPIEYGETTESSSTECPGARFEICATDGVTYGNVCAFVAARRADEGVQFARLGCCPDDNDSADASFASEDDRVGTPTETVDQCAFACPAPHVYAPVCTAATGVVFPNKCAYVSALCRDLLLPPAHADLCDPLVLPPTL